MERITIYQKLILVDLYQSISGLNSYTFFKRYKLMPNELYFHLKIFINKNFVQIENGTKIILTIEGRNWVILNIKSLDVSEKEWRKVPKDFLIPQRNIREPYVPQISKLDKVFFKKIMEAGIMH